MAIPKSEVSLIGDVRSYDLHSLSWRVPTLLNTAFSLLYVKTPITLNTMETSLVKGISPYFKSNYLRLIASGQIEKTALEILEVDWIDFFEICSKDPEFRANIEDARKSRADRWIDGIAESLDKKYLVDMGEDATGAKVYAERAPNKDELGRDKLQFEKMKFLAQADNPEKYAAGAKPKINVEFDMTDFKLLNVQEAAKVLINDPFARPIDAEFTESKEKDKE